MAINVASGGVVDRTGGIAAGYPQAIGTFSIWFKPDWSSGNSAVKGISTAIRRVDGIHNRIDFFHYSDNNIYMGWSNDSDGSDRLVLADTGIFTNGTWGHHLYRWNANTTTSAYFINGVSKVTSSSHPSTANTNQTFAELYPATGTGSFCDFALWTVVLTDSEVTALSKGMRPPSIRPASLYSYAPLFGDIASAEPDLSGYKNNLTTLTNTSFDTGPPLDLLSGYKASTNNNFSTPITTVFRRTLSLLGTRTGSRQLLRG